ncbi:MAG: ferritin-like domain-containing protein, partial [Alphaproteobacteria bacterium]|nr:ferritin-like domain-containing protein [Alphaproteobacteria bacterium]
ECGTSSYYSAIRDATDEPVLQEVAGRIAADEFRHYRLFFETLNAQPEADLPLWKKLYLAFTRVKESDDDELAYAYYCANVSTADTARIPYDRAHYARAYNATAMALYRRHHIKKLVQMVAKACGLTAQSRLTNLASTVLWHALRLRAGSRGLSNA